MLKPRAPACARASVTIGMATAASTTPSTTTITRWRRSSTLTEYGTAGLLGGNDLVERLVALDHAELEAGALLDGLLAFLEVAHLHVERVVARLLLRVVEALRHELPVQVPHPRPAALPEPQRILQREEEAGEDVGERFHRLRL